MSHKRKTALVLGSGGARGWAHIGVIRALRKHGFKPDLVVGTSIGALVGAMLAADVFDAFEQEIQMLTPIKLAALFTEMHLPQCGLLSGKPIQEWLRQPHLLGKRSFSDLTLPFAAVATDLQCECEVVLRSGNVADAVRASCSIPGIFDPILHEAQVLVDGGLSNPIPVNVARQMGADRVIAVDINTHSPEKLRGVTDATAKKPTLFATLLQTMRMAENEICRRRLACDAPDILLRPAIGHLQTLDFYSGRALIATGEEAVALIEKDLNT